MSETIVALMAAVVGGLAGAGAGWFVARRQARSERAWEIAFAVSEIQAQILSAGTPSTTRTTADLERLEHDWQVAHRRFYLLGHRKPAAALTKEIDRYLKDLAAYIAEEISREELEEARIRARDAVTRIMEQFSNG